MKALVLTAYNRFELQDRPIPEAGPGDVLLKVAACGSDDAPAWFQRLHAGNEGLIRVILEP